MKKTVVITGGTSGFGLATAKAFKNAGYTVLITARSKDKLEQAQKESGADFIFVQDVKNYNEWLALYDFAKQTSYNFLNLAQRAWIKNIKITRCFLVRTTDISYYLGQTVCSGQILFK